MALRNTRRSGEVMFTGCLTIDYQDIFNYRLQMKAEFRKTMIEVV
jgi:hypothetical protein